MAGMRLTGALVVVFFLNFVRISKRKQAAIRISITFGISVLAYAWPSLRIFGTQIHKSPSHQGGVRLL